MVNVIVLNVSLIEGMAGSMHVGNLVEPLIDKGKTIVSNLVLAHTNEKSKIGEKGSFNKINYLYIGYKNPINIFDVYKFYRSGTRFIKASYKDNCNNIIYNYGYPDIKNIFFIFYARSLGFKVLFHIVEDNRFTKKFSGFLAWLRMKSSLLLIKKTKNIADAVIVLSEHLKDRMEGITKGKVPVYHIPIAVNFKYYSENLLNYDINNLKIFYGGSFNLEKDGIEYLIKAFNQVSKQYSNISLVLSGIPAPGNEMDIILEMIKENVKITYIGYLSKHEYYQVLNEADIFCMPRNNSDFAHAGFPYKLGEFLATGKAIIATNVGDVPIYLENYKNALLINPESEEEIRDAIIYCIQNPEIMKQIGKEAKITALKYFNSEVVSNKFIDILESV